MNPNINIELGRFLSVPQAEICEIIKNEISISPISRIADRLAGTESVNVGQDVGS
jgi:plasmid maintenance system antidote protein VapI